ncbi:hypothetical protein [Amantichitinum ursilacus]|uniref:Uncharacterized protein n=1 Tax=Amantichitinum ursilacus TaxID=857265 RepID=A0A0N0GQE8_9NEIS|nr:hypothetical protein [Amantichitinum ursilacus]KPC54722.1 hypothetical protein WG78_04090 [Amantichitinum ursilacus]
MTLDNLLRTGNLKAEPPSVAEFLGLLNSAGLRLNDAHNAGLSLESRFDLAYNAAHALSLAALRWHGMRCDNRYLVFQCLPLTVGAEPAVWRVLARCHQQRNLSEYEGSLDIDARLLADLLVAADWLLAAVKALPPCPQLP